MFAFGGLEILILLLAGAGTVPDLVSVVDPVNYFAARQVEVTIDKMVEVAAQHPKSPATQIRQLLALRYLAEHTAKLSKAEKSAAHRKTLEAIATGMKAQDAQGFAKEYAERVLARLDGKDPPPATAPKLREDALSWFPADATLVGALDSRLARGGPAISLPITDILKKVPAEQMRHFYDIIDKFGNVRIDRIAFAYAHDDKPDKARIVIRLTGKANVDWLLAALQQLEPKIQVVERKDPAGKPVKFVREGDPGPVLVFLGNEELIVAGHARDEANAGNRNTAVADEVLTVRAGKKASAINGPFKTRLQKVPDRAVAMLVGDVPATLGNELKGPLGVVPVKIDAFIDKLPPGFDVSITGTMATAADAQTAVMKLSALRKQGIDMLQQMLKQPDANPRVPVNSLINLMESLQMQSEGTELRLRVLIPRDILQGIPAWFLF